MLSVWHWRRVGARLVDLAMVLWLGVVLPVFGIALGLLVVLLGDTFAGGALGAQIFRIHPVNRVDGARCTRRQAFFRSLPFLSVLTVPLLPIWTGIIFVLVLGLVVLLELWVQLRYRFRGGLSDALGRTVTKGRRAEHSAAAAAGAERMGRFGGLARVVIFNIFATEVALLVAFHFTFAGHFTELRAEVFDFEDDELYRLQPNLVDEPYLHGGMPGLTPEYESITVSTNSLGYRDYEHELEKPPGVYRIAVVGDSFVFGLHLLQENPIFGLHLQLIEQEIH